MPFRFGEDFDDASEAFIHGAMCVLPGHGLDIEELGLPSTETEALSGLYNGAALHAVLVAAVQHPEWAAAWHAALAERCAGACKELADEFVAASPIWHEAGETATP